MINLYDILDAADGQLFGEPAAQIFNGFCFDVRQVKQGDLFVALKTEWGDGHYQMEEAVRGGAIGIMCTHPPTFDTSSVTVMIMRDVEAALMRWTKYILQKYGTTVIAVTGSSGKSTARHTIAHVLSTRYNVYSNHSSFPGKFALPLSLGGLSNQHQLVVLEYTSSRAGDMSEMISVARPTVGVVTNGTARDALSEERILVESLIKGDVAILNYDDPIVRPLNTDAARLTMSVDLVGASFGADLTAYNVIVSLDKTGFDLRYGSQRHIARWVPLLGAHQLYSVLASLATGLAFSVPLEEGLEALTNLPPMPGHMNPLEGIEGTLLVDDSYSATPQSFIKALDWLEAVTPRPSIRETQIGQVSPRGRIWVVMGDISEIGSPTQPSLLDLGKRLEEVATFIVSEGDTAAAIARSAVEQGFPLAMTNITFAAPDAVMAIKEKLRPKDVVLFKGSASARMERVVAELLAKPEDRVMLPRQEISGSSEDQDRPQHPTWLHVDTGAIAHNVRLLKSLIGDTRLMAVVKADGYGHGAVQVSTTALLNGADSLGVATVEEAMELREAGINAPVLVMGYAPIYAARQILTHDLTISLYDLTLAKAFNRAAAELDTTLKVHVRVDPGVNGLGLPPDEVSSFFRGVARLDRLKIEGMYMHLDSMMADHDIMLRQFARFEEIIGMMRAADYRFEVLHAAGSAAALHIPETRLGLVRCGSAIYGLPSEGNDFPLPEGFRPALDWKTTVIQVKRLPAGTLVGMGGALTTAKSLSVAVLPIGMTDGFRRDPNRWDEVLIHGKRAPIFGQVGMYQTLVDVSQIDDVRVGDEVVLLGKQGDEAIRLEDVAKALKTTHYEVISTIMPRHKR